MSEIFSIDAVSNIIRDLLNDMGYRFYDMLFNEVAKKFRVFIDKEVRVGLFLFHMPLRFPLLVSGDR